MDKMALTYSFRRDMTAPMKVGAVGGGGGDINVGDVDIAVCCSCVSELRCCRTFSLKRDITNMVVCIRTIDFMGDFPDGGGKDLV